ncbi:MAG: ABC transporter permease [Thiohalomonadales bacterium]
MSLQSSIFKDVLNQALFSLGDNRLRTFLSIVGIAIGIGAVMTVGTVSQGAKDYVYKELDTYGLTSIWIYRDWGEDQPDRVVRQGSGISNADYQRITEGCCPAIVRATPVVYANGGPTKIRNGNAYFNSPIEGVDIDYLPINNDELSAGRNFRPEDIARRRPVAIIGAKAFKKLFGTRTSAIGKKFRLYKQKYTIIGVLKEKNRDLIGKLGADEYDINGRVLIPYTLYQNLLGSKDIHTLQAEAKSLKQTGEALEQVTTFLLRRHNNRFKYTTESMDAWIDTAEEYIQNFSLIGLLFAIISLVVGGMGIMNIMSTSVIERTREIGIRKAIGASNKDILMQFLMESVVVSTVGGFIGLIIGIVAAYLIGYFSGYPLQPSWITAAIALVVSMLVGILSGYYPAHRAAQLHPVDALRHE